MTLDLTNVPAILDVKGVNRHLVAVSRTQLDEWAKAGDIEVVRYGRTRKRRGYVRDTVVAYLTRCAAETKPNEARRKRK